MRRLVPALLMWWLTPPDSVHAGVEERKKAFSQGLKTYLILNLLLLFLSWHSLVIYCVWLLVALIHGAYQYRYAFAATMDRPSFYNETAATLLLVDIVNHFAMAWFSRIGLWGLTPVGLAWFFFGRTVGPLAVAKELRGIFSLVRRQYPADTLDRQAQMTRQLFQERLELLAG